MRLYPLILSSFDRPAAEQPKGFTLVEVLVAISIFTIAITSIYGVFTSISASKDRLDLNSETYHQARVVLDRIGREVHGIYKHSLDDANILKGGFNEKGQVFLELSTTATVATNIDGKGFASVRYELVEDNESEEGSYVIMRTEEPLLGTVGLDDFPAMRMATGIKSLSVRYFSDSDWSDKWDQSLQGFPDMLEIMITAYDKEGGEIPFLTAFKLPAAGS
ncbi:prepilin-type N-terminal cleavage/methylation domain-containing protein [uncultured Desulfuromusa sp.]|uniref:prepilin-type N-terminal cleavage/methylation domain-containing protein n=1 Tax=uncultured Desulfuromusa sp. TaxID=219183 RepID=UPI002AA87B46|nr:prepilin-type N-terminal cleavage/methylation domain-containing protein [uncultured Desulfuromusa sp.]